MEKKKEEKIENPCKTVVMYNFPEKASAFNITEYKCKKSGDNFKVGDKIKVWNFGWVYGTIEREFANHAIKCGENIYYNTILLREAVKVKDDEFVMGKGLDDSPIFEDPKY